MAAQKGNQLSILRGDGASPEVFTLVAGVRSKSITVGGDPIDVTTDDDIAGGVSWRTFISGIVDFDAEIEGVLKDEAAMKTIIGDSINGTVVNYQADINLVGTFEGPMVFTNLRFTGEHTDAITFTANLRANAALTWTPV